MCMHIHSKSSCKAHEMEKRVFMLTVRILWPSQQIFVFCDQWHKLTFTDTGFIVSPFHSVLAAHPKTFQHWFVCFNLLMLKTWHNDLIICALNGFSHCGVLLIRTWACVVRFGFDADIKLCGRTYLAHKSYRLCPSVKVVPGNLIIL